MRVLKNNGILGILNSYLIDSPQPSNLSYAWNGGSLLGLCLVVQLVTGIFLGMHYIASAELAFISVEDIMRNVNYGWLIRYTHANGASLFFGIIYLHIWRALIYGGYRSPRTLAWSIGVVILILLIITAFLGYVLPYGQMSLWGATVITNLVSAVPWIGESTRDLIWGAFSVASPTVTRFYVFHYVAAFALAALAILHMIALHENGSGNPIGISSNHDRTFMHPLFLIKDLVTIFLAIWVLAVLVSYYPNLLGHSDNYIQANSMQTPSSIVPEWYLLSFYAILRSVPNKLLGVIAMLAALLVLLVLPFVDLGKFRGYAHRIFGKYVMYSFALAFFILLVLGARHVEAPYILVGQLISVYYFIALLVFLPVSALAENSFNDIKAMYAKLTSSSMNGVRTLHKGTLSQLHPFHLVDVSPWPFLTSILAGNLVGSFILVLYDVVNADIVFFLTLATLVVAAALWWLDVISEGHLNGDHSFTVVEMLLNGFILFIISEVMLFFAVFWAFFHSSLSPAVEVGTMLPPIGIEPLNPAAIPTLNTALLLSSGASITWSHHALIAGRRTQTIIAAVLTIILAIVFTVLQGYEYYSASFTWTDSVYGNTFFFATGLHGLHVILGTFMIIVSLIRIIRLSLTNTHHLGYEAAILYWHFVDIVWLFLYVSIYWWGS